MTGVICFTVEVALTYFKLSVISVTPSKIKNTNHLRGSEGGGERVFHVSCGLNLH